MEEFRTRLLSAMYQNNNITSSKEISKIASKCNVNKTKLYVDIISRQIEKHGRQLTNNNEDYSQNNRRAKHINSKLWYGKRYED